MFRFCFVFRLLPVGMLCLLELCYWRDEVGLWCLSDTGMGVSVFVSVSTSRILRWVWSDISPWGWEGYPRDVIVTSVTPSDLKVRVGRQYSTGRDETTPSHGLLGLPLVLKVVVDHHYSGGGEHSHLRGTPRQYSAGWVDRGFSPSRIISGSLFDLKGKGVGHYSSLFFLPLCLTL